MLTETEFDESVDVIIEDDREYDLSLDVGDEESES